MRSEEHAEAVGSGIGERPRIALVLASMQAGGAERVALNLAEEFAARGLRVDLVLLAGGGVLLEEVPDTVRVVDLAGGRASRSVFTLAKYLKTASPDAVIAFAFHVNIIASIAALLSRCSPKLVLSVHSTFSVALREYGLLTKTWMMAGTLLFYRRAHRIITVSDGAREDLIRRARLAPAKVITIYNPVLRPDFEQRAAQEAEHPWARQRAGALIVAAGRLTRAKDYPTLIRAFAQVRKQIDSRLLILGEGALRTVLETLVEELELEDRVALAGRVGNVLPIMKAADVFVLSSSREGFGNVLVEAMACGVPVVSTNCPSGPREILANGRWGRLVPVGDPAALAEAIRSVLTQGGIDARSRAQDFTVAAAADRYLAAVGLNGHAP